MTITRRQLLVRSAAAAGAGLLLPGAQRLISPQAAEASVSSVQPYSMAMHLHASFSEGDASMESHVVEAMNHGVDALWWTEHDWRMMGLGYRRIVHFDAMSEAEGGRTWTWSPVSSGALASSSGEIVTDPCSALDPNPPGALRVAARSASAAPAAYHLEAQTGLARYNERSSLAGQLLEIEVCPEQVGPEAYLEILILSSWHPATGGRPAGQYSVSYRIGGAAPPGTRRAQGLRAVVNCAAQTGRMNSLRLTPAEDLQTIWPGMDARDFTLRTLRIGAVSRRGAPCSGVYDYLRFTRAPGDQLRQVQSQLLTRYANAYPSVAQFAALEVSGYDPHINWYGGVQPLPDYGSTTPDGENRDFARRAVVDIHSTGGLASYNHMYGTYGSRLSVPEQDARLASVAAQLVRDRALDADLIEVGYRQRAGVNLERHVAAWDVCSRNGIFITGNGVSDSHNHGSWAQQVNRFLTWAWAPSKAQPDLLAALRAGRAYIGEVGSFSGSLDLLVDGCCLMGSVSLSTATTRSLLVTGAGLPPGGTVRLRQGLVDYAGASVPAPNTATTDSWPTDAFVTGSQIVSVDNRNSSFVRTEVLNGSGRIVALSNPLWLFTAAPLTAVPIDRQCACA